MILGKTVDFAIYRGITFFKTFTYKAAGEPVNLTGKKIEFHVRAKNTLTDTFNLDSDTAPTINGTGVVIIDAVNGRYTVKIANEDTSGMTFDTGSWWTGVDDGTDPQRIGGGSISVHNP